uniref:HDC14879 n=1 Tax=Drosophila melanogaster TaxID=7227 RepID=Q6IJH9_DROME|nr:TPA_inf: HDC14879 [Drosophila melanogaster]
METNSEHQHHPFLHHHHHHHHQQQQQQQHQRFIRTLQLQIGERAVAKKLGQNRCIVNSRVDPGFRV